VADALPEQGRDPPADHPSGSDSRILPQLFYSSRDSEGRLVANNTVWKLRTTAKLQNLKSSERAILNFESRLRHLAQQRGIPDSVVKRAIDMYHKVREKRVFNKPNLTELALGLLLTAAREMKYLVTLRDLPTDSGASVNKVKNYHYAILRALGLAGPGDAINSRLDEMSANQYVVYFAAKLGVVHRGQVLAEAFDFTKIAKISMKIDEAQDARHCVGAAALYIALQNSGSEISQRDFCGQVNLSEISLREWQTKLSGHDKHDKVKFVPPSVDPDELDDGP
jgi:transcription initiation factor TFIIIB Brf1 subunit/transcription initiation factor TFIIB